MKLLRITASLDPKSGKKVPAWVVESDDKVYMIKKVGGDVEKVLLEDDPRLYKLLCGRRWADVNHLYIEPTFVCNLNCPVCFTHGQRGDVSVEEVEREILHYKNKIVSISGGEPTLRCDLPQMIRVIARNNIPLLATNGLKLANLAYVKKLEKAGLRHITFSFNGFSDNVYVKINGAPLVQKKLKALQNLKKTRIKFLLSMLLIKGVNEGEIEPVVRYAIRNDIKEVRIRAMAPLGRYVQKERTTLSEMVEIVCRELGIRKEIVYKELELKKQMMRYFPFLKIWQKLCGFSFHLKVMGENYKPVTQHIGNVGPFSFLKYAYHVYGLAIFARLGRKFLWKHRRSVLKVSIRCWPTAETLDFYDHVRSCGSRYVVGKKRGFPVCYANILENLNNAKDS